MVCLREERVGERVGESRWGSENKHDNVVEISCVCYWCCCCCVIVWWFVVIV